MRELARWRSNPVGTAQAEKTYAALNAKHSHLFLYRFENGEVSIAEKPPKPEISKIILGRAQKYLGFFADAAHLLPENFKATIAMAVGDKVEFITEAPVFCFQKRRGSTTILVPDIDFLDFDFYEHEDVIDTIAFEDKIEKAIFIGGTTGGRITPEIARLCGLPRLRAAKFFQDNRRVEFRLPQIVQATSQEARAILQALPFCRPGRMDWKQQLSSRFLISMDGNGATCSRVAIALRSNSVLLKYDSEELLYYFHGMQPWEHYIPITRDEDVEKAFDIDSWSPGTLESVARQGRDFAEKFLTRAAVTTYMAQLLALYPACFVDAPAPETPAVEPAPKRRASAKKILSVAHVEEVGDSEADGDGWVGLETQPRRIEGFSLSSASREWQKHVTYQAIGPDGRRGDTVVGGAYCGTRGRQVPIHGFVLQLAAGSRHLQGLAYEGIFQDGFRSGLLAPGTECVSPAQAALVAMRVVLQNAAP